MRAILTDLDRTLTGPDLRVDAGARDRLVALRERGLAVVIVTGRRYEHLVEEKLVSVADAIVAENGAVVADARASLAVEHPRFAEEARQALGPLAARLAWGRVVGSGPRELATRIRRALADAGVSAHLSFNADEVMVLPKGVDKASGARLALRALAIAPSEAAAIGDGENDVPLFRMAGRSAAVANAHPAATAAATERTRGAYAAGFVEFADRLLATARPRA